MVKHIIKVLNVIIFFAIFGCASNSQPNNIPTSTLQTNTNQASPIASYDIQVELNPNTKQLTAQQTITYKNTTPQAISKLVFHLYLNAFRDTNSIFLTESGTTHRAQSWDPNNPGWIKIENIELADGTPLLIESLKDDTLAQSNLPHAIVTGETVTINIEFIAQLPKVFARTGFADDFFMVGQWFPKLGVWENGAWNAYPFHANAEFYADFGQYDVAITLPENYVVGASGVLINSNTNNNGTKTLNYQAKDVIDFAWTASPHFQQATKEVDGINLLYLYLPEHAWTVEPVLNTTQATVARFNRWYGAYPYSQLTLVDVPDNGDGAGGMEYPTLITVGGINTTGLGETEKHFLRGVELVTIHEIAHQWWQSMVASNEAEEPWLDEGIADYSTLLALEDIYKPDAWFASTHYVDFSYLEARRVEYLLTPHVPMAAKAWEFTQNNYSTGAYAKPVLALRTLENILGSETMQSIMHTYFQRYQFAHPNTQNFQAVAEEVSKQDLAWFFDGIVYGKDSVNYKVAALTKQSFTIHKEGSLQIPTEILVTFSDGNTILENWDGLETEKTFTYPDTPSLVSVQIDPERKIALDLRWSDNSLSNQADSSSWLAINSRIMYSIQDWILIVGGL